MMREKSLLRVLSTRELRVYGVATTLVSRKQRKKPRKMKPRLEGDKTGAAIYPVNVVRSAAKTREEFAFSSTGC